MIMSLLPIYPNMLVTQLQDFLQIGPEQMRPDNLIQWSVDGVCEFIEEFLPKDIAAIFRNNEIDGKVLFGITEEQLENIGIKALGVRMKIIQAVGQATGT